MENKTSQAARAIADLPSQNLVMMQIDRKELYAIAAKYQRMEEALHDVIRTYPYVQCKTEDRCECCVAIHKAHDALSFDPLA